MIEQAKSFHVLGNSLELPCGAILRNRLAKSPMSDSLANGEGDPTEAQIRLYERWAQGGAAVSFIGEVQGDSRFPEKPGNLVLTERTNKAMIRSLVSRATIEGAHLWPQLGHAGLGKGLATLVKWIATIIQRLGYGLTGPGYSP